MHQQEARRDKAHNRLPGRVVITPGLRPPRSAEGMGRFTAWLSDEERHGLDRMAEEFGSSTNYVLRLAVRAALGLSLPKGLQFPPEEARDAKGKPS